MLTGDMTTNPSASFQFVLHTNLTYSSHYSEPQQPGRRDSQELREYEQPSYNTGTFQQNNWKRNIFY